MLVAGIAVAFVDRQALALLLEPIKADLHASDTQMSLLYGFGFSLFYVVVGIPIARLADRFNRRNIIVVSILAWSVMTAFCGAARSFVMLLLGRVGVGVGEAGLNPAGMSMLADYFPKERLGRAMGVYSMGIYLGGGLAIVLGGLVESALAARNPIVLPIVGTLRAWQVVFMVLGAPGLVLALLFLTVREPVRRSATGALLTEASMPVREVLKYLRSHAWAYIGILLGFALMILVGYGVGAWIPAFLQRKFGWTTAQIGTHYGPVVALCGACGAVSGGAVASWLKRRGVALANPLSAMFAFVALVPVTIAFPLVPTATLALLLIAVMNYFAGFTFGGGYASMQEITPNRMRAVVGALYSLTVNLIGASLGPLSIALFTDRLFHDPTKLPQALALTCAIASPLAVLFLWIGLKHYSRALAANEAYR